MQGTTTSLWISFLYSTANMCGFSCRLPSNWDSRDSVIFLSLPLSLFVYHRHIMNMVSNPKMLACETRTFAKCPCTQRAATFAAVSNQPRNRLCESTRMTKPGVYSITYLKSCWAWWSNRALVSLETDDIDLRMSYTEGHKVSLRQREALGCKNLYSLWCFGIGTMWVISDTLTSKPGNPRGPGKPLAPAFPCMRIKQL